MLISVFGAKKKRKHRDLNKDKTERNSTDDFRTFTCCSGVAVLGIAYMKPNMYIRIVARAYMEFLVTVGYYLFLLHLSILFKK